MMTLVTDYCHATACTPTTTFDAVYFAIVLAGGVVGWAIARMAAR